MHRKIFYNLSLFLTSEITRNECCCNRFVMSARPKWDPTSKQKTFQENHIWWSFPTRKSLLDVLSRCSSGRQLSASQWNSRLTMNYTQLVILQGSQLISSSGHRDAMLSYMCCRMRVIHNRRWETKCQQNVCNSYSQLWLEGEQRM